MDEKQERYNLRQEIAELKIRNDTLKSQVMSLIEDNADLRKELKESDWRNDVLY